MANDLNAYKSEQMQLLEAQRARAQESAAINQQKLLKYLKQTSAGQSVGMTESAKIAAANNYSRDVAAADATYNQGVADLNHYIRTEQERLDDKEYERKWNEDERDYNRGRDAIADARYEDERDYSRGRDAIADARYEDERDYSRGQDAKAEQDEIYGEVMTKIESGEFNTVDELSKYLNTPVDTDGDGNADSSILALMSPTQRAMVEGKLSYYRQNPEQKAAELAHQQAETAQEWAGKSAVDARKEFGGADLGGTNYTVSGIRDSRKQGDNFTIKNSNGKSYSVQLAQKIVETDTYNTGTGRQIGMIQHFNKLGLSDGEVFTVNGHAYIKLGTDYYEVEKRTAASDVSFKDFLYDLSGGKAGKKNTYAAYY